jgi:hypothetical protein
LAGAYNARPASRRCRHIKDLRARRAQENVQPLPEKRL